MEFLEAHARALYRILNHGDDYTDCRCIDVNRPGSPPLSREVLKGEEDYINWCKNWNGRANCYVGRNPRNKDGTVSRITTYSLDVDPEHPPRTSVDGGLLAKAVVAGRDILQMWPGGYLAESGNGVMVLYRLASPVFEDLEAFKRWLADWQGLVRKFLLDSTKGEVRCDPIHDNERIVKIPGTMSVKGESTNWRLARFVTVPCAPYRTVEWLNVPVERPHGTDESAAPTSDTGQSRLLRRGAGPMTIERMDQKIIIASSCLARLKPERCEEYDAWIKVGLALSELGPVGLQLWDTWSRKSSKYAEGACSGKWATFTKDPQITVGSLVYWADQDSPRRVGLSAQPLGGQPEAISINDFMASDAPVAWICERLVARGAIGFVAGLPETLKTWLLIDLAVECARRNGSWLGMFPVQSAKVLFIDQERFKGETQRRFRGIVAGKNLTLPELNDRLFIRCGTTTRLDLEPSFQAFRSELSKIRPDLVLVDSFATFHTREENNRKDIQEVMEKIKALRQEFNCTFVFVDHENKGAYHAQQEGEEAPSAFRMAGSVAKPAAAEFVFTVRRFDATSSTVYHTKSTLAPTVASFNVRIQDVPNGIVVRGTI